MTVLLDNGLPRGAADLLTAEGFKTTHVGQIGLARAEDYIILDQAYSSGCIVVTLDADFHTLLALSGAKGPSVIRLRLEGLQARDAATLITSILQRFSEELQAGCVISVGQHAARCHLLPFHVD